MSSTSSYLHDRGEERIGEPAQGAEGGGRPQQGVESLVFEFALLLQRVLQVEEPPVRDAAHDGKPPGARGEPVPDRRPKGPWPGCRFRVRCRSCSCRPRRASVAWMAKSRASRARVSLPRVRSSVSGARITSGSGRRALRILASAQPAFMTYTGEQPGPHRKDGRRHEEYGRRYGHPLRPGPPFAVLESAVLPLLTDSLCNEKITKCHV